MKILALSAFIGLLLSGCASPTEKAAAFKTSIVKEGSCSNGGAIDVVVNSDRFSGYTVSYEEKYTNGGNTGTTHHLISVEAGSRRQIGCTVSSSFPMTIWKRRIVGEVPLK